MLQQYKFTNLSDTCSSSINILILVIHARAVHIYNYPILTVNLYLSISHSIQVPFRKCAITTTADDGACLRAGPLRVDHLRLPHADAALRLRGKGEGGDWNLVAWCSNLI